MSCMPSAKANTKTGMAMDNLVAMVATLMPNSCEHVAVNRNRGKRTRQSTKGADPIA